MDEKIGEFGGIYNGNNRVGREKRENKAAEHSNER
jgi:hypothetical protein